jgi:hypothetical protein
LKINRALAISSLLCLAATQALAIDVIGNGGFEDEGFDGPGSAFYWGRVNGGAAGTGSARSSDDPITGSYSQVITAVGAPAQGSTAGVVQNTYDAQGGISLAPGSAVRLSFDARGNAGPGGVGFYAVRIVNSSGAIVVNSGLQVYFPGSGVVRYTSAALTVPAFGEAPNDAFYAFAEIVVAAGAFDGSTITATLDNVSVEGTLVETGPACPADFNADGGVDGADIESFFTAWEAGDGIADVNADGGVDGSDVETFFAAWKLAAAESASAATSLRTPLAHTPTPPRSYCVAVLFEDGIASDFTRAATAQCNRRPRCVTNSQIVHTQRYECRHAVPVGIPAP